jgi:phytoene dehydrogenase-like protein
MASAAREHGVEIRTASPVARVLLRDGRAEGVRLESGEELRARAVLANTDPKRTFLTFVGREHLDPAFADGIAHLRMGHASLRLNLALNAAPEFAALSGAEAELARGSSITLLPDRATVERNYRLAREGRIPDDPYVAIVIPSTLDDGLAPAGHHVMSLLCKYYPYRLADGQHWDALREPVADRILASVARHIPNLPRITVARQVLTPLDLERVFGLTEGDIFHGRHDLDQLSACGPIRRRAIARRSPGHLCGSGSHPRRRQRRPRPQRCPAQARTSAPLCGVTNATIELRRLEQTSQ